MPGIFKKHIFRLVSFVASGDLRKFYGDVTYLRISKCTLYLTKLAMTFLPSICYHFVMSSKTFII